MVEGILVNGGRPFTNHDTVHGKQMIHTHTHTMLLSPYHQTFPYSIFLSSLSTLSSFFPYFFFSLSPPRDSHSRPTLLCSMSGSLSSMGGSCLQQREAAAASAYPYMFHDPLSSLSSSYQRSSSQLASCGNAASQAAVSSFNAASHAAAASYAAATSSASGTGTGECVRAWMGE